MSDFSHFRVAQFRRKEDALRAKEKLLQDKEKELESKYALSAILLICMYKCSVEQFVFFEPRGHCNIIARLQLSRLKLFFFWMFMGLNLGKICGSDDEVERLDDK